jgi:hypothetical protein
MSARLMAAVISQTTLDRCVVVAWSYGAFVVADYIRAYGEERIAGLDLVGPAVMLKPPAFDHIAPGFLDNAEDATLRHDRLSLDGRARARRLRDGETVLVRRCRPRSVLEDPVRFDRELVEFAARVGVRDQQPSGL